MSYDQLRAAFERSSAAIDHARNSWRLRLHQIKTRQTWKPIIEGPVCVSRITPIGYYSKQNQVDLKMIHEKYVDLMFPDWGGASRTFNLDGVVIYGPFADNGRATTMVQVYRDGTVDVMRYCGVPWKDSQVIPSQTVAEFFRNSVHRFSKFISNYNINGPFSLDFAIVGVDGYEFGLGSGYFQFDRLFSDRDDLIMPDLYAEQLKGHEEKLTRSSLDVLWQSFGVAECNYYDADGNWIVK